MDKEFLRRFVRVNREAIKNKTLNPYSNCKEPSYYINVGTVDNKDYLLYTDCVAALYTDVEYEIRDRLLGDLTPKEFTAALAKEGIGQEIDNMTANIILLGQRMVDVWQNKGMGPFSSVMQEYLPEELRKYKDSLFGKKIEEIDFIRYLDIVESLLDDTNTVYI